MPITLAPTKGRRFAWTARFCRKCGCDFQVPESSDAAFCSLECESVESVASLPVDLPLLRATTRRGVRGGTARMDRTWRIWYGIVQRTTLLRSRRAKDYAGRGIDCDPRWLLDYDAFRADMGPAPVGMSIERIDNDKGYWKENCTWAGLWAQARNKRSNVWVTLRGERLVFSDACATLGTYPSRLRNYCARFGSAQATVDAVVAYGSVEKFFREEVAKTRLSQHTERISRAIHRTVTIEAVNAARVVMVTEQRAHVAAVRRVEAA